MGACLLPPIPPCTPPRPPTPKCPTTESCQVPAQNSKDRIPTRQTPGFPCTLLPTWLGVDMMPREPSALTPSHAQPEPKRPAAAALNLAFISSTEPKDASTAALRSAEGPLVEEGAVMT